MLRIMSCTCGSFIIMLSELFLFLSICEFNCCFLKKKKCLTAAYRKISFFFHGHFLCFVNVSFLLFNNIVLLLVKCEQLMHSFYLDFLAKFVNLTLTRHLKQKLLTWRSNWLWQRSSWRKKHFCELILKIVFRVSKRICISSHRCLNR